MKNQVLLENYYLPGELKARIGEFVDYYNTERYHESLKTCRRRMFTPVGDRPCLTAAVASSRKRWPSDVGYTL